MVSHFKTALLTSAVIAAFIAPGCGTEAPKDTRATDEIAIRQQSMAWTNAAQSHDMEKVLSFYAPDAVALPDGAPIALNKDAIRAVWQNFIGNKNVTLSWKTTAVGVAKSSDIAYEYGAYTMDVVGKDAIKLAFHRAESQHASDRDRED